MPPAPLVAVRPGWLGWAWWLAAVCVFSGWFVVVDRDASIGLAILTTIGAMAGYGLLAGVALARAPDARPRLVLHVIGAWVAGAAAFPWSLEHGRSPDWSFFGATSFVLALGVAALLAGRAIGGVLGRP